MKSFAQQAIELVVWSLNLWLEATGAPHRITTADVVMTERDDVIFIAFPKVRR